MSSKNYGVIKSLSSAIGKGLTPGQTYDLVNRVADDLNEVFTAVFTGPLPANDAKNLTNIQRTSLPAKIAWTDLANTFTESQSIEADNKSWINKGADANFLSYFSSSATKPSRFQAFADGKTLIGSGVSVAAGVFSDDGGNNSGIILNDTYALSVIKYLAGVLTHTLRVDSGGQTTIGALAVLTNLLVNELGLQNSKSIRGTNAAGNDNLNMIVIDGNNLVQLGVNNASGDGAVAIPKNTAANLPAAGGTRNGIITIDTTNNRLCYYSGGNRYFIPIGTIF